MAIYRTKSRDEATAFCRSLVARGYRQVPPAKTAEPIRRDKFRIYRERNRGKPTAWIRVSYYEPRRGPFRKVPEPIEHQPRGSRMRCVTHSTHGLAYSRGLCANCYHRWAYWTRDEHRERMRARVKRERSAG